MSVCCLFVPFHVVYFEAYFAPTSRSRMSKDFRALESLGKSDGKKWSQNGSFLLECGLKSPRKKSEFFADFALQNMMETMLPDGLETSSQRVYQPPPPFFIFFFLDKSRFLFKLVSVPLSALVERVDVSRMRDFLFMRTGRKLIYCKTKSQQSSRPNSGN